MKEDICDSCGTLEKCAQYIHKGDLFIWCDNCKEGE